MHEQTIDAGVEQDKEKMSVQRDVTYPLVRTPPPPVRRHHQIAASGRDP